MIWAPDSAALRMATTALARLASGSGSARIWTRPRVNVSESGRVMGSLRGAVPLVNTNKSNFEAVIAATALSVGHRPADKRSWRSDLLDSYSVCQRGKKIVASPKSTVSCDHPLPDPKSLPPMSDVSHILSAIDQ